MTFRDNIFSLDTGAFSNENVSIKPLAEERDLIYACYECRLAKGQEDLVSPMWFTMGRAYLHPENNYPCIIYNEKEERIGFINLCVLVGVDEACTWSCFIDERHQGKGYGKGVASLAISILKEAFPNRPIRLSSEQRNARAHHIYSSLGFIKLDELDGDDFVFEMK